MGKMKKIVNSSKKAVSVGAYGERLRRAIWHRQSRTGDKFTFTEIGKLVAESIGRKAPFTSGTVSGWLESRSEPELAVFLAIARWTGVQAGYLAFGKEGVEDTSKYESAIAPGPEYYESEPEESRKRG